MLATCVFISAGAASPARAEHDQRPDKHAKPIPEYLIKAAFLYNFARFTEWPSDAFEGAMDPIRLCILGQSPFGRALETIDGKTVRSRMISVVNLVWADEASQCHMLFISTSAQGRVAKLFDLLAGKPILTVSDWPEVAESGSIIGLEIVKKKIRFRVNVDAATNARLQFSSRLLNLAKIIRNERKVEIIRSNAVAGTER